MPTTMSPEAVTLLNILLEGMNASYSPEDDRITCHGCGYANECCECGREDES